MRKTKLKRYSKKHKHLAHHRIRRRRYNHSHLSHHQDKKNRKTHKHRHRRRVQEMSVVIVPGSESIPIFRPTNKKRAELIRLENQSMGNVVPGLRNYLKNV